MNGHQPKADGPLPAVPTTGSGVQPPIALLRRANRELLRRCHAAVAGALSDTPETVVDPLRRPVLEDLLADIAEELGAKVVDAPPQEDAKPRTVRLANGTEVRVRG